MADNKRILRIAIPTPLRRSFDYLPSKDIDINNIYPGCRVSVPFGKRNDVTGIVISIEESSDYPSSKLKHINYLIDDHPLLNKKHLDLLIWTSRYYHHPVGEIIFNSIPKILKSSHRIEDIVLSNWQLSKTGKKIDPNDIKKSLKQAQIINFMQKNGSSINESELIKHFSRIRPSLLALEKKGYIKKNSEEKGKDAIEINQGQYELNKEQTKASKEVLKNLDQASIHLLDGLTGSGKTEVYMSIMESVIRSGQQCLVLLPEIGLTPQHIQRFEDRFKTEIAIQHSGLSDSERLRNWLDAKSGKAKLVLGTRSAIWTPLAKPGLYIIDEEHDLSYKQQDGFRYSARDMLIVRAKRDKVPVVLGSATPSLESLYNVKLKRYEHLVLSSRAGDSISPKFQLLDIRGKKMHGALSQVLVNSITEHLKNKNQVLLFLNRRGYAAHIYCHHCAWKAECPRCDLPYTFHKSANRLCCHHCDSIKPTITDCPECGEQLLQLGHGTERIEEVLNTIFKKANIARIDRDTTRKKGSMTLLLEKINSGEIDILIGTQMLAKGHDFPNVTLTAIIDADRGLFSTDFRASERMAQLFMQVSGRTGRGKKPGTVIVQTHYPEHPIFHQLIHDGYNSLSSTLLDERKFSTLPPYSYMALLRAEAHNGNDAKQFLNNALVKLKTLASDTLTSYGPLPALVEKRSGRFRYQLIIQSNNRNGLHKHLDEWLIQLESMRTSRKVRWSLDIDPQDMS